MVLTVAWAKKYEIIDENIVWYKEKWEKGKVFENMKGKLVWDFEYKLRQSSSARRPDVKHLKIRKQKKYGSVTWHAHRKITLKPR